MVLPPSFSTHHDLLPSVKHTHLYVTDHWVLSHPEKVSTWSQSSTKVDSIGEDAAYVELYMQLAVLYFTDTAPASMGFSWWNVLASVGFNECASTLFKLFERKAWSIMFSLFAEFCVHSYITSPIKEWPTIIGPLIAIIVNFVYYGNPQI